MATDWAGLVADIEARIAAFARDGQPEHVTEPAAGELAELTWRNARDTDGAVPLDAASAVARLYWARHQALAPRAPADDSDLGAAVAIFAMIDPVAPETVPEELRLLVDEARREPGSEPFDEAAAQAVELLTQVQTGQAPGRLDEVIQRFRQLLAALRAHEAETGDSASTATVRGALLSDLSLALHLRVERAGNRDDVAEAVRLTRAALGTLDESDDSRAALLGNAAMVLGTSFEYTGDPADLDEAIALGTRALATLALDHPQWARWASNLSGLHRIRFDVSDNTDDLDQAVGLAARAAELPANAVHSAGLLWSNVSNGLDARYGWTRNRADLDAAVEAARRAMQLTAPSDPDRGPIVANVAHLCLTRFEQWGGLEDIDESITLAQEALGAGTLSPPKRAALLSNLANAYRFRYEHLRRPADLDHALVAAREAAALTGQDDPWRASRLTSHAMALLCEFERSAEPLALTEALAAARAAVDVPGTRLSLRSKLFSNLAVVLAACAEAADDPADRAAALDEAVTSGRQAVDILPPGHPDLSIRMTNLAGTLTDRSRMAGHGRADVWEAVDLYRHVAGTVTASTSVRVQAARSQGAIAARNADWPAALDGYTSAVGLLGTLVTRAIARPSREILLSRFAPLASEAAACAVGADRAESAVELLEQSRAVLWSQALDTGAARALRTADAPWARRLAEVAAQLE